MGAALAGRERMDFIDDHRFDGPQRLSRVRRQHEVDRFRSGYEDVARPAQESRPFRAGRVAGAGGDHRLVKGGPLLSGHLRHSDQRRAQIPLDVDGQRLDGRDVEDAAPCRRGRGRMEHQPIDGPEERREGFACPGRGEDQGGVAARDRRPAELLRLRRLGKNCLEPLPDGWMERGERVHHSRIRRYGWNRPNRVVRHATGGGRRHVLTMMRFILACAVVVSLCAGAARAGDSDAIAISADIQARHLPFGTLLDPMNASPTSTEIVGYTRCGDSALWTGAYLAAESFRYNVTKSADALKNVRGAVAAIKGLSDITGDNRLARCIVLANSPYAAG